MTGGVPHDVYIHELDKRRGYSNAELLRALGAGDTDERSYAFTALVNRVPHSGAFAYRRTWTAEELQGARRALLGMVADRTLDPAARAQALYGLGRLGLHDVELVLAVQRAFGETFAEVRVEALRAFPEDDALAARLLGPCILAALDDPSSDVQWTAVHRLGELPDVGRQVTARLFELLRAEDPVALAAAYTLHRLVERGVLTGPEAAARVEAAPLTSQGAFLVCSLLDAASDAFLARAVLAGPAVARIALTKLADTSPQALARALGAMHQRDPSGLGALLDEALAEDDDYQALARGYEEVWAEALRSQRGAAEPGLRARMDELLARWSEA